MSTHKKIDLICVVCIIIGLVITGLFSFGESFGIEVIHDEDTEANEDSQYFSAKDLNPDWDTSSATEITLSEDSASISGSGTYFLNNSLYITAGGYYVISGTFEGSIIVDAYKNSKVWIMLDGVSLYAEDTAAIIVEQADKVFLTLAQGSENTVATGGFSEAAQENGINAAIFARDDLTINGYGTLTITDSYGHGIKAKDDLVITGGTLNITAAADGINANDTIRITGAVMNIDSGNDGLDQDNAGGYFYMESGTLSITAGDDGIHAEVDVTIDGGTLVIDADDYGIHAEGYVYIDEENVSVTESTGSEAEIKAEENVPSTEAEETTAAESGDSDAEETPSTGTQGWWLALGLSLGSIVIGLIFVILFREKLK